VSALKQVPLQLPPHNNSLMMHSMVFEGLLSVSELAAYAGVGAARAVTFGNTMHGQAALAIELANDCPLTDASASWLALTGRGLAVYGRALEVAGPMLKAYVGREGAKVRAGYNVTTQRRASLLQLSKGGIVVEYVTHQLALLAAAQQQQQGGDVSTFWAKALGPTRSATQAVDGKVLRKLQKKAGELHEQLKPLHAACSAGADSSSSTQQQVGARRGYIAACGSHIPLFGEAGWLPAALQELGEALAAAFPHKWACNDPACVNMAALTEMSAAKKACTDCKVRSG
jgi:hypothetical protein